MASTIISIFIFAIILLVTILCITSFLKSIIQNGEFSKVNNKSKKILDYLLNGFTHKEENIKADLSAPEYLKDLEADETRKIKYS